MNIAICDDNNEYISTVENYIDKLGDKKLDYDVFFSGEELIRAYESGDTYYDAIFLDMEMGGMNGVETANQIRKIDKHVIIVFITCYSSYMKDSFECLPFRFLLKPLLFEDFVKVICEVRNRIDEERMTFIFSENRNKIRLYCDNIIYFESQTHSLWIHTKEQKYKTFKSMGELCRELDNNSFFRVHNSYTINLGYVKEINDNIITLYDCDAKIPIGRAYKKEFIKQFIDFKERKYAL